MKKIIGCYFVIVVCLLPVNAMEEYTEGFVDLADLQLFVEDWLDPVDMEDFAFFAQYWLTDVSLLPSMAWWEMEETGGDFAYDSTDNAYDLVHVGGMSISDATTPGRIGSGFKFDGTGERLTHPTLLDELPDGITIAGWVRPDATGMSAGQCWFSKQNVGSGTMEQLWLKFNMSTGAPTSIGASFRSGGVYKDVYITITWQDDTWYHYAFTWDSSGAKIYIDGILRGSNPTGIMGDGTAIDLSIGTGGYSSQPFKGVIDDVRIYSSVLTAGQIKDLYDSAPELVTYDLIVNGGSGDGSYVENRVVDIAADAPPAGQVFDAWTGDTATVANIYDSTTTVTMPAAAVTLTATYKTTTLIVTIRSDFPGGNVLVESNAGSTIHVAPDQRDNHTDWFYWYFEATANQPAEVTFVLPTDIGGVGGGPAIGMQGPAISYDDGATWDWLGDATVDADSFTYDFTADQLTVRFAVTMPYLQSHLDAFLAENASSPHLTTSVLAQTLKGRDVELLQIGQPGAGKKAVLFTARHHACETMASYVLEGVLQDAISDTAEAVAFRNNYVLYVVPFVDKDGVEEGDQGKNRSPHDHNRDYGPGSLYPEVDAIEALGVSKNIQFVMDYHCPTLRLADHQVFYFAGPNYAPVFNMANVSAFAALIDSEFPPNSPGGPLNWMNATVNPTMCARYFAIQPGMIMSTTLEVPYAPPGKNMDAASGLLYGAAILRAWMGMTFQYLTEYPLTVNNGSGDGSYIEGSIVNISADAPPAELVFDAWIGDTATVANIYDPTTTVTMPAAAVTVTATYKEPGTLYTLTVNSGTGSGSYSENTVVDIVADAPPEGEKFVGWTGDTAYLADADEPTTSITMPAQDVTVTATYQTTAALLLAWWEMEETEGDFAYDSTDNAYDLVPVGGMSIPDATTPGKFGNGFAFNGDGGRFTHPTLLDELPDGITIAGWVKPDATGMSAGQCWFSKQNVGSGTMEQLWLKFNMSTGAPTSIGASFRSGGVYKNVYTPITWQDDTWYHYAFTWDSSGAKIYIDGILKGSNPTGIMGDGTDIDLSIGTGGYSSQPFKGVIDDVRIYNGVLTAEEITDLYNWSGDTTYALTVNNGSGDGSYAQGTVVNITADAPVPP